jgi:uncharacterized membrane protein required for colicin V production
MIAAATNTKLWFNWFDVALVLILAFGFWRGRKHGMTKEFIPFFRWLFIVIFAGLGGPMLSQLLVQTKVIKSIIGNSTSEATVTHVSSYLIITVVIWLLFVYVGRLVKPKLEHSNFFGGLEYYLGILAGVIRYACITLFGLALLHAPYYTPEEIAAKEAYNNRWYGGGLKDFKGDYIPTIDEAQVYIFNNSLIGPFIDKDLKVFLIYSGPDVVVREPVMEIKQ